MFGIEEELEERARWEGFWAGVLWPITLPMMGIAGISAIFIERRRKRDWAAYLIREEERRKQEALTPPIVPKNASFNDVFRGEGTYEARQKKSYDAAMAEET